jgi:hypothetical protein
MYFGKRYFVAGLLMVGWWAAFANPPGDGWKRVGDGFERMIPIKVTRAVAGNTEGYQVPFPGGGLSVAVPDGDRGYSVHAPHGSLDVEKRGGKVAATWAKLDDCRPVDPAAVVPPRDFTRAEVPTADHTVAHDLDADGAVDMLDFHKDDETRRVIVYGDRLIQVELHRAKIPYRVGRRKGSKWLWDEGRMAIYVLDNGKWVKHGPEVAPAL